MRAAIYEGSYGPDTRFYTPCRCRKSVDDEWETRIKSTLAQYLSRTARRCRHQPGTSRHPHSRSIHERSRPASSLGPCSLDRASMASRGRQSAATNYGDVLPLARSRCPNDCHDHPEHIYIACFSTPTTLRDMDKRHTFMQLRRMDKATAACAASEIARQHMSECPSFHRPRHRDRGGRPEGRPPCPRCGQPLG